MVGNVNEKQTISVPKKLNLGKFAQQLDRPEMPRDLLGGPTDSVKLSKPGLLQKSPQDLPPDLQNIVKKSPQLASKINELWARLTNTDLSLEERLSAKRELEQLEVSRPLQSMIRDLKKKGYGKEWDKLIASAEKSLRGNNISEANKILTKARSINQYEERRKLILDYEKKLSSPIKEKYAQARTSLEQAIKALYSDNQSLAQVKINEFNGLIKIAQREENNARLEEKKATAQYANDLKKRFIDDSDQIKRLAKVNPNKAMDVARKLAKLSALAQLDINNVNEGFLQELRGVERDLKSLVSEFDRSAVREMMDEISKRLVGELRTLAKEHGRGYAQQWVAVTGILGMRDEKMPIGLRAQFDQLRERQGGWVSGTGQLGRWGAMQNYLVEIRTLKDSKDPTDQAKYQKIISNLTDLSHCHTVGDLVFMLDTLVHLYQAGALDWKPDKLSAFVQNIKNHKINQIAMKDVERGKILAAIEVITLVAAATAILKAPITSALGISGSTVGGFLASEAISTLFFTALHKPLAMAFGIEEGPWKSFGEFAKELGGNYAMFLTLGAASRGFVAVFGQAPKLGKAGMAKWIGHHAGALSTEFMALNTYSLLEQMARGEKGVLGKANLLNTVKQNATMLIGLKLGGLITKPLVSTISKALMSQTAAVRIDMLELKRQRILGRFMELGNNKKIDDATRQREAAKMLGEYTKTLVEMRQVYAENNTGGIFGDEIGAIDAILSGQRGEAIAPEKAVGTKYTVRGIYLYDAKGERVKGVQVADNVVQNNRTYREFRIGERTLIRAEVIDKQVPSDRPYETTLNEGESIEIILGKPKGDQPAEKLFLTRENGKLYLERPMYGFRNSKGSKVLLNEGSTTVGGRGAKLIIPDNNLGILDRHFSIKVEGNRISLQATGETHVRGIDAETVARLEKYTQNGNQPVSEGQAQVKYEVETRSKEGKIHNTYTAYGENGEKIAQITVERDGTRGGQLTFSKPEISPNYMGKPEVADFLRNVRSEEEFTTRGTAAAKKYSIRDGKLYENDKPQEWVAIEQKGNIFNLRANISGIDRIFAKLAIVKGQFQLQPVGGGITEAQLVKMFGEARAKQIIDIQQSGVVVETPAAAKGAPSVEPTLAPFVKPGTTNVVREHGVFDPQFIMNFRAMSKKAPVVFVDLDETLLQKKPGTQEVSVNPDAATFLAGLKAKGYKVVILSTGTSDYVSGSLKKAGLDGYCDLVIAREAAFDWNNVPVENINKIDEILQKQGVNQMSDDLYNGYSKGNIIGLLVPEKGRAILVDNDPAIATDRQFLEPGLGEYEAVPVREYAPFGKNGTAGKGTTLPEVLAQLPQFGTPTTTAKYQIKGNMVVDQAGKPMEGIGVEQSGNNYKIYINTDKGKVIIDSGVREADGRIRLMGGDQSYAQLVKQYGETQARKIVAAKLTILQGGVGLEPTGAMIAVPVEKGTAPGTPNAMQGKKVSGATVDLQARAEVADAEFRKKPNQTTFDNLLRKLFDAGYRTTDKADQAWKQVQARHAHLFALSQKSEYKGMSFYEIEMREGAKRIWEKADPAERAEIIKLCKKFGLPENSSAIFDLPFDAFNSIALSNNNRLLTRLRQMRLTLWSLKMRLDSFEKSNGIQTNRLSLGEAMRASQIRTGQRSQLPKIPSQSGRADTNAVDEPLGIFIPGDGRLKKQAMNFFMQNGKVFSFHFAGNNGRAVEISRSEDGNSYYVRDNGKFVLDAEGKPRQFKNGEEIILAETPHDPNNGKQIVQENGKWISKDVSWLKIKLEEGKVTVTDRSPQGIEYAKELKPQAPEVKLVISPAVAKPQAKPAQPAAPEANPAVKPQEVKRAPEAKPFPYEIKRSSISNMKSYEAMDGSKSIGSLEVRVETRDGKKVLIIEAAATEKQYQRQGVYQRLLTEALRDANPDEIFSPTITNAESKAALIKAWDQGLRGEQLAEVFRNTPLGQLRAKLGFTENVVEKKTDTSMPSFEVTSRKGPARVQEVKIGFAKGEITSRDSTCEGQKTRRFSFNVNGGEAGFVEAAYNGDTVTILEAKTEAKFMKQGIYRQLFAEAAKSSKTVLAQVVNAETEAALIKARDEGRNLEEAFRSTPLGKVKEASGFTQHRVTWNEEKWSFEVVSTKPARANQAAAK